jgi:hypothetical protein
MNKIKSLLGVAALLATLTTAQAQTVVATNANVVTITVTSSVTNNTSSTPWYIQLFEDGKAFFTDGTNYFNQGTVQAEVGPVANINNAQFGFDANIQFPVAQQASVGFDVFYYGGHVYDGTVNTTLGTTWTVLKQPIYTYTSVGVGTDLQSPGSVINIEWVGARTDWTIKTNLVFTGDVLTVGVDVGAGHVSNITGTLARVEGMFKYTY